MNRKTELELQEEFIKKHGLTVLPPYRPGKDCIGKKPNILSMKLKPIFLKKSPNMTKFNRYRYIIKKCYKRKEKQKKVAKFLGVSQQAISKFLIKFKNILFEGKKDKKKAIIFLNSAHTTQSEISKLLGVTQQYVSKVLVKHRRETRR